MPLTRREFLSRSASAIVILPWLATQAIADTDSPPVTVNETSDAIVLDNGLVQITVDKRRGQLSSIIYRHSGRSTELGAPRGAMYFDSNIGLVNAPDLQKKEPRAGYQPLSSYLQSVRIVHQDAAMVDIAIEGGPTTLFPFRTEVHFVLPRGESGFYAYAIYEHGAGMPAATIGQTRFTIKGVPGTRLFTDHVVDDRRMGPYPASPIVRQVMDATFLLEDGTVYTKYNNTAFMADHHLHGMTGHGLGLWMITPSNDYVNGGPLKQELTVHKDNVLLAMLQGAHFGSGELTFADGEEWTKFYGPVFVYCNSGATTADMYADAKQRAHREMSLWPYQWVDNADYPLHRGTVKGRIALTDGASTEGAWIVLAATGGDWPLQGKGYQFWTKAGKNGEFTIEKVRPGTYTLYACGANQFDQFHHEGVAVSASATTDLGKLDWKPVKHGRTIWQIGTADRSTQEYKNGDDVRHWAMYLRYPKDFPDDVTFTIGQSRENVDWNFAQWSWFNKTPFWTIRFDLPDDFLPIGPTDGDRTVYLTFGIAASNPFHGHSIQIDVSANGQLVGSLDLKKSGAAAYRSGGQDSLYVVETLEFSPLHVLKPGANEITLQIRGASPFPPTEEAMKGAVGSVMYDAIRLEID